MKDKADCLLVACTAQMAAAGIVNKKIVNAKPSELEESVAKALIELEVTTKDLSADLRDLFITSVKVCSALISPLR